MVDLADGAPVYEVTTRGAWETVRNRAEVCARNPKRHGRKEQRSARSGWIAWSSRKLRPSKTRPVESDFSFREGKESEAPSVGRKPLACYRSSNAPPGVSIDRQCRTPAAHLPNGG